MKPRTITLTIDVSALTYEQTMRLVGAIEAQCEGDDGDDGYPQVPPPVVQEDAGLEAGEHVHDDDCRRRGCDHDDEELDAEAEYGRDTERDYDPDEDRTP